MVVKTLAFSVLVALAAAQPASACTASWYGREMRGHNADGTRWNPGGLSIAHRSLPFGTMVEVCYHGCRVAPVKDRGPAGHRLCADLSQGLARAIGMRVNSNVGFRVVSMGSGARAYGRRARYAMAAPAPVADHSLFGLFEIPGL